MTEMRNLHAGTRRRALYFIIMALLLTGSYTLFQDLFSVLIWVIVVPVFPPLDSYLSTHLFLVDTILTFPLLLIYGRLCIRLLPEEYRRWRESGASLCLWELGMCLCYALGAIGISTLWFWLVENVLLAFPFWEASYSSFNEAWSGTVPGDYGWMLFSVVLLGPVVEELLFRGLVLNTLGKIRRGWLPVIGSGILFGLFHAEPVQVVYTAIMGILLGLIYEKTRRLELTITIHIANNLISELSGYLSDAGYEVLTVVTLLMCVPVLLAAWQLNRTGRFTA